MAFEMNYPVGADVETWTASAEFGLGTIGVGADGSEWVYVVDSGSGVTGEGYALVIDEDWSATMTSLALTYGDMIGIAKAAGTASYYGWAQRKGVCNIRVAASCGANADLNATSTVGQIDDDNESGSENITGLILTTANGGSAGTAPGLIHYPTVSATTN